MFIIPKENFRSLGIDPNLRLVKGRVYKAIPATNQPNWKEQGKVFVFFRDEGHEPSILLDKFDYDEV